MACLTRLVLQPCFRDAQPTVLLQGAWLTGGQPTALLGTLPLRSLYTLLPLPSPISGGETGRRGGSLFLCSWKAGPQQACLLGTLLGFLDMGVDADSFTVGGRGFEAEAAETGLP